MASRYYETKEVTVSVIPRAQVTQTDLGILVYQGDSNPESQYAPSLLRKFMLLLKSAERRTKTTTVTTRSQLATTLAFAYDQQMKAKPRGKLMDPGSLSKFDKKHPEYRILVCKEEMFGNLLKVSNIIANSRALFKYGDWFDQFLAELYPNHPLIGNKVWMLMSTSLETRNLIFVGRCLAVAVNTGETEALKANPNFNSVLSALAEWTSTKIEHKSTFSQSKITEAGWEVPDKIRSFKTPAKVKASSTPLVDYKGNLADIPDGNEDISVEGQVDNNDDASSSHESVVGANATDLSSDDDSAPEVVDQKLQRSTSIPPSKVPSKATKSVSSNSESESDSESDSVASCDKKPAAVSHSAKRVTVIKLPQKPKRQKTQAKASTTQSTSVVHVDYSALLPYMSMNFGTKPFMNIMLGKFPDHVSNDGIIGFCFAYNLKEIPKKVFLGYEPFLGALKIYTTGVDKHMKYFQLLKADQNEKALLYATGVHTNNPALSLDSTRIIMHRASDLSTIFGSSQENMDLELSSVVDVHKQKAQLPTSNVAPIPQTKEAFKLAVDSVLPDKKLLAIAKPFTENKLVPEVTTFVSSPTKPTTPEESAEGSTK
eukprot:scaffold136638_cov58-Attheya_sp.AAC.2